MRDYETMVVFVPNLSEEEITALVNRITDIISQDGEVVNVDQWGTRTLAYKIANKYTEGYYVQIDFKAPAVVLDNLEHFYKINDSIIRSIIVKKD